MEFIVFIFWVLIVLLGIGFVAAGIAMLPILLLLGGIYLVFTHPIWGIPLLLVWLFVAIARKA